MLIKRRSPSERTYRCAIEAGLSPLLAHILACRLPDFGGDLHQIIRPSLKYIDRPELLQDSDKAANRIAGAIVNRERIGVLTDYDVDGVTSHAVLFRALTEYFGVSPGNIDSLIGHRMNDGYGVSPRLTDRVLAQRSLPDLIITADCGSSDEVQIARLKAAGIDVVVTDHHALPVVGPPKSAWAVVNPARQDCSYPDSTIAGCMIAWLLMSYVRRQLIERGYLPANVPKLSRELDYVGLGTVADCVSIGTAINRAVVNTGLHFINRLQRPCWRAIHTLLGRADQAFDAEDLAFQIGPRINARSRLADPYAALRYLLADTDQEALNHLSLLDRDNQDRKVIERDMVESAWREAEEQVRQGRVSLVIYLPGGHPGVQGIVASRLVQAFGRPAIVLCEMSDLDQLTGSARSIAGVDIRSALQQIADAWPGVLIKFGGHRYAAGLALYRENLPVLQQAFERMVRCQLNGRELTPMIWTDGVLDAETISLKTLKELEQLQPYGREFEHPLFEGIFHVDSVRAVGLQPLHLVLVLRTAEYVHNAIWFRALKAADDPWPVIAGDTIKCVYKLHENVFRGGRELRLMIEYAHKEEH